MTQGLQRTLLIAVALYLTGCSAAAPAPGDAGGDDVGYAALQPRKALAVQPGSDVQAYVHSQPADLIAARAALAACNERRSRPAPACELRWLNDHRITSGAELKARAPAERHPLYLWRYEGDNSVVYLAGSIHILKPSLYPLPRPLLDAYAQSDTLVLEVDTTALDANELNRKILQYGILPGEQRLADVLPGDLHQRLAALASEYGQNLATFERFKPSLVMTQLVVGRLMSYGYEPETGVEEAMLADLGSRTVRELEDADAQFDVLFNQSIETQIDLLRETLDQNDDIEPLMADMVAAWLAGDDASFDELFRRQSGETDLARAFNKQLIDDRNLIMTDGIEALFGESGRFFVLVGTAHFIGDAGIIAELARRGYEGRRIYSDATL